MIIFDGTFTSETLHQVLSGFGRDIFFLQIGAMDGVSFDPIHAHVKQQGWKGIFVEPLPDMMEKLRRNYAGCPNLAFVQAAITNYDGEIEITRIDPAAVEQNLLPPEALGISTLLPERGVLGGKNLKTPEHREALKKFQKKTKVQCLSLPSLVERLKIERLDCVFIDTEGADWLIARQLPLQHRPPRLVYLEFQHLNDAEKTASVGYFRTHGYKVYIEEGSQENFLAIKADEPA